MRLINQCGLYVDKIKIFKKNSGCGLYTGALNRPKITVPSTKVKLPPLRDLLLEEEDVGCLSHRYSCFIFFQEGGEMMKGEEIATLLHGGSLASTGRQIVLYRR